MTLKELKARFSGYFSRQATHAFFCPGRVNLIGEHIDYNGGMVLPCDITMGTYLLIAPNDTFDIRLRSINFTDKINVPIGLNYSKKNSHWFNYPLGVILDFALDGHSLEFGWGLLYFGDLPVSSLKVEKSHNSPPVKNKKGP